MAMIAKDAATKLAAARTRLILDKPFLGALVLRLPMQEAGSGWCRTTATDMRTLYYNPAYIDRLSLSQTEFVLAHEALHCALSHFVRRGHRVQSRWDLACDFAINPLLVNDGLMPPAEAVILKQFDNMTAEEIYPCLDDSLDNETLDQHLYDSQSEGGQGGDAQEPPPDDAPPQESSGSGGGEPQQNDQGGGGSQNQPAKQSDGGQGVEPRDGPPQPLTAQEREQLAQKWQQYVASAAQQAAAAGKPGGAMARLVESWLQPKLPWRALLAHYFFESARSDYNYMRPSRREGDMIMPSLKSPHSDMVVALDTSGSIGNAEMTEFISEINAIKGALPVRITLLACDAKLTEGGPWTYEPWEDFILPRQFTGGGGTRFEPVFEWVDQQGLRPDVLVYFTDALGDFPSQAPGYPVLWLVKGKGQVPWGRRVQLN
ncbi:MAG: VWA-like domain-containing protein [Thiobacillaceae bacterium]